MCGRGVFWSCRAQDSTQASQIKLNSHAHTDHGRQVYLSILTSLHACGSTSWLSLWFISSEESKLTHSYTLTQLSSLTAAQSPDTSGDWSPRSMFPVRGTVRAPAAMRQPGSVLVSNHRCSTSTTAASHRCLHLPGGAGSWLPARPRLRYSARAANPSA